LIVVVVVVVVVVFVVFRCHGDVSSRLQSVVGSCGAFPRRGVVSRRHGDPPAGGEAGHPWLIVGRGGAGGALLPQGGVLVGALHPQGGVLVGACGGGVGGVAQRADLGLRDGQEVPVGFEESSAQR